MMMLLLLCWYNTVVQYQVGHPICNNFFLATFPVPQFCPRDHIKARVLYSTVIDRATWPVVCCQLLHFLQSHFYRAIILIRCSRRYLVSHYCTNTRGSTSNDRFTWQPWNAVSFGIITPSSRSPNACHEINANVLQVTIRMKECLKN